MVAYVFNPLMDLLYIFTDARYYLKVVHTTTLTLLYDLVVKVMDLKNLMLTWDVLGLSFLKSHNSMTHTWI